MIRKAILGLTMAVLCTVLASSGLATARAGSVALQEEWQIEFNIPQRSLTHTGESRYFVLNPGFQLVLEARNEKVTFTVLDETREINRITTRVVEERTEEFGALTEVIRNFVAIDRVNGDVFHFGEDVEKYQGARVVSRDGSWLAYTDGGRPGLLVPGAPVVGMKYYLKFAPGITEDRAEVISTSETLSTPAGVLENGLVTRETSPLEPGETDQKSHARGIGLAQDGSLRLTKYGYVVPAGGPAPASGAPAPAVGAPAPAVGAPAAAVQEWQTEFNIAQRSLTHIGESTYFVLNPGFQLVLEGGGVKLTITVLDETKEINGVTTRVVEEREEEFGELVEVSLNFFAIDPVTGDVFYFGEDVDIYQDGEVVSHDGAWLAYRDGDPGLIMPGTPVVGMRYYQELAPGVALDRAEVTSTSETVSTPAGIFRDCLVTTESSDLEPGTGEKVYAPGIGLIRDGSLRLVTYGYLW